MSVIDDVIEILAQSPLAFNLRLPNAPEKLLVAYVGMRYVLGPGDDGVLGYVCDRGINPNPHYVPSSFFSGTFRGEALLPHSQVGVIGILFSDTEVEDKGVFFSIHQRMATLPNDVVYETIGRNELLERVIYKEKS